VVVVVVVDDFVVVVDDFVVVVDDFVVVVDDFVVVDDLVVVVCRFSIFLVRKTSRFFLLDGPLPHVLTVFVLLKVSLRLVTEYQYVFKRGVADVI
jgi:hypothetical protein